jgi:RNA exonuclease 4
MVGVGIEGVESSLARVSLVNYYGAVQLDEFVRQKERVVDYRTQWSGIRETDMIKGASDMPDEVLAHPAR